MLLVEPCLLAIQQNPSVRSVEWYGFIISSASEAFSAFLGAATSLQSLEINNCRIEPFDGDRGLDLIGRSFQRNTNIQSLKLIGLEQGLVVSILQSLGSNTSVRTLSLANIFKSAGRDADRLRLNRFSFGQNLPIEAFRQLLLAIKKSQVKGLSIGLVVSQQHLNVLIRSIPAMKLRDLDVGIYYDINTPKNKTDLLQAFKRNFTLHNAKVCNASNREVFDEGEKELLKVYTDRNKRLAQWIENPSLIPTRLWPEALGLALEAGADSLYRSLLVVLGSDFVSAKRGKKRKRMEH